MNAILRGFEASTALEQAEAARVAARIEQANGDDADEEQTWLSNAPLRELVGHAREDVIGNARDATAQMHESGLVRINNCISTAAAAALLDHLDERLIEARANLAATPNDHGATKFIGNVRRPINRTDLKFEVLPPVAAALAEALAPLRAVCSDVLGADAELFELGAFISDPKAPRQGVHPDTQFTPDALACSTLIALQDIDESMGPTEFLPGTHHAAAHTALQTRTKRVVEPALTPAQLAAKQRARALAILKGGGSQAEVPGAVDATTMGARERLLRSTPRQLGTMRVGDAVMFDTRVLHCGGANTSSRRRVLFYFSFRVQGGHTPYGRDSLDEELQKRKLTLQESRVWLHRAQLSAYHLQQLDIAIRLSGGGCDVSTHPGRGASRSTASAVSSSADEIVVVS